MIRIDAKLPKVWPEELPPDGTPDFWFAASKLEMSTRDKLSEKIRLLVDGAECPSMTPLEAWLYRRRAEWAVALALGKYKAQVRPDAPLDRILNWMLVDSWNSDGCIGMWTNAERHGEPHADNPEGLTPWK